MCRFVLLYLSCLILALTTNAEQLTKPVAVEPSNSIQPPLVAAAESHSPAKETKEKQPVPTLPAATSNDLEPAGLTCAVGSDSQGLRRLIKAARELLPVERLRNIITNAAQDPEVQSLRKLLRSPEFRAKVDSLQAKSEYRLLHAYTCERLQLDYGYYVDFIRVFLNVLLDELPTSSIANARPGVRGLWRDLRDALPRQQLRELYNSLVATDRELTTAVRRIRSSEFRRLLRDYRGLQEYDEVFVTLAKAGISARTVQQIVATALGWGTLDVGAETTLVNL